MKTEQVGHILRKMGLTYIFMIFDLTISLNRKENFFYVGKVCCFSNWLFSFSPFQFPLNFFGSGSLSSLLTRCSHTENCTAAKSNSGNLCLQNNARYLTLTNRTRLCPAFVAGALWQRHLVLASSMITTSVCHLLEGRMKV